MDNYTFSQKLAELEAYCLLAIEVDNIEGKKLLELINQCHYHKVIPLLSLSDQRNENFSRVYAWADDDNLTLNPAPINYKIPPIESPYIAFFSSGSTGANKIIIHKYENLKLSATNSLKNIVTKIIQTQSAIHFYSSLSFHHIGGFLPLLRQSLFHKIYPQRESFFHFPKHKNLTKTIKWDHVNVLVCVPTQLRQVLQHKVNHQFIAYVGGAKVDTALLEKAKSLNINLVATYGMTESAGAIFEYNTSSDTFIPLSDVQFRIEYSQSNRLLIKSKTLAIAIIDDKKVHFLDKEHFFKTNDYVVLKNPPSNSTSDEIRSFKRADQTIICGGENIDPNQMEKIIKNFFNGPFSIKAIAHNSLGHIPVIFVEPEIYNDEKVLQVLISKLQMNFGPATRPRAIAQQPQTLAPKPSLKLYNQQYKKDHKDV